MRVMTAPAGLEQASLLIAGDVMLDRYWFGDVSRISPEAPVPIVRVERKDERLGGAANVARNAAMLGAQIGLMGVVGDDEAAQVIDSMLREQGVASYLHRDTGIDTIVKLRVLGRQQQLLRIDFEEAPDEMVLQHHLAQYSTIMPNYKVVVLSDYAKGALANVTTMIDAARKLGKIVLVDPKGDDFTIYRGASLLTPNKSELIRIVGHWKSEEDLTNRAQNLRASLDLQALLLTRSEEGMSLYEEGKVTHFPTMAREVFDVSGAGDTVIATLAVMLAAGVPLVDAVTVANRAGGIVVGKLGTATVTREELFPG